MLVEMHVRRKMLQNRVKITQALIDRLPKVKAGEPMPVILDTDLRGFGVRTLPSGRRFWMVRYRAGRIQRRISLGDVAVVPVVNARAKAKELLAAAGMGHDPQADRKKARAALTVRELIDLYLERRATTPRLRPRSIREIERHLLIKAKRLHGMACTDVDRSDIAGLLAKIAATAPIQANRVRANLSSLFAWAMTQGITDCNPVAGTVKPSEETVRKRKLTVPELAMVWRASDGDRGVFGVIVKLLILTGARREEIGGMRTDEIENGRWTVPAHRTKGKKDIVRPLPEVALALIRPFMGRAGSMFGRNGEGAFSGWSEAKSRLNRRLAGIITEEFTLHDLRRSVATAIAGRRIAPPHIIEAILGHRHADVGLIHSTYNQADYEHPIGEALAEWAKQLLAEVERPGKIIYFQAMR